MENYSPKHTCDIDDIGYDIGIDVCPLITITFVGVIFPQHFGHQWPEKQIETEGLCLSIGEML